MELSHLYGYATDNWTVTAAPGHEGEVTGAWDAQPLERGSGHSAQFLAMYDALDAGRPLPAGADSARQTLELAAAIYASAFTGTPVRRGEIVPGHPFYDGMDGGGLGTRALDSTALAVTSPA